MVDGEVKFSSRFFFFVFCSFGLHVLGKVKPVSQRQDLGYWECVVERGEVGSGRRGEWMWMDGGGCGTVDAKGDKGPEEAR